MKKMTPRRVLFVDDENDIQLVAQMGLEMAGFVVETCNSGNEALEKVGTFRPDVILMDVLMPGLGGVDTIKKLHTSPGFEKIPVVFMTAMSITPDQREEFNAIGVLDVISKPFDPTDLATIVNSILEKKNGENQEEKTERKEKAEKDGDRAEEKAGEDGDRAEEIQQIDIPNFQEAENQEKASLLQKKLDDLQREYQQKLPEIMGQIEKEWRSILENGWNKDILLNLRNTIHQLAGSGGIFGFPFLSSTARSLDTIFQTLIEMGSSITPSHKDQIEKYFAILKGICQNPKPEYQSRDDRHSFVHRTGLIFLADDDVYFSQNLSAQLMDAGYELMLFNHLQDMKDELEHLDPDVVIMDIMFPEGMSPRLVADIQQKRKTPLPVIFISKRDDMEARLQSVRAGGYAYFTKPLDIQSLLEKLDTIIPKKRHESHILMVDDDVQVLEKYSLILQNMGMVVQTVSDPMKVMDILGKFQPDLILMDVSMPQCNGIELVSVIRQKSGYETIPIVFLTAETNPQKRVEAMIVGGDDLLNKPVDPDLLVSAIKNRLERQKLLQGQEQERWKKVEKAKNNLEGLLSREEERRKEAENAKNHLENRVQELEQEIASTTNPMLTDGVLSSNTVLMGSGGECYTIDKALGRGGMGVTYRAYRKSDKKVVAIKTLLREFMSDVKVVMRFVQEAQVIMTLNHDNLVKGLDVYQSKHFCYLVMEFVDGVCVGDILEEQGAMNPLDATAIVLGIARGLAYLENRHIVHRDIKPDNIILTSENIPKLVDFGIVKITDRPYSLTTPMIILGTPFYLSPEQTSERDVDIRSDIYSLGATFFHMVTGDLPFKGNNTMHILQQRFYNTPKPSLIKPDVPSNICKIIEKMMQLNRADRHQSAMELVKDLERVLQKL